MVNLGKNNTYKVILFLGFLIYSLFSLKEIGNFYQSGHAGFINAEVGLSEMNTINNGFIKTKFGATNYKVIYNRAPTKDEYYVRYPYLHPLMVSALWKITGPSEVAARLFTIILVFASFIVFYFIARELDYSNLSSAFVFFSLCSFPVFYHYASLSHAEISALLPIALSYYFYLKFLKGEENKHKYLLLISLSLTCQLFWYGYLVAFAFFLDSLLTLLTKKEKKSLKLMVGLIITVAINITIYAAHTLWLAGTLKNAVNAFLWRASIKVPTHQRFTWLEFFIKNISRFWLFNPVAILLAFGSLLSYFFRKKRKSFSSLRFRMYLLLFLTPLIFILLMRHLVHYHDFLLIYFSFFLALSSVDLLAKTLKKITDRIKENYILYFYILILISWAVLGLIKNPEEKMIDKETDNYELYYVCQVISNTTHPSDKILLSLKRLQEPQVRFYLRRESVFLRNTNWAKNYIDSNVYSYYLVEDKSPNRPLIKYLLQRYRGHKYDRYFLFHLRKPGKRLRAFKREKRKTNFFFKYFVSSYHYPGKYQEIKNMNLIKRIYFRFEKVPDLYPSS